MSVAQLVLSLGCLHHIVILSYRCGLDFPSVITRHIHSVTKKDGKKITINVDDGIDVIM